MNVIQLIFQKFINLFRRIIDWFQYLPLRLYRLVLHFGKGLQYFSPTETAWKKQWAQLKQWTVFVHWLLDLFFYVVDILGVGELYETFLDIFKFNTRPMTEAEIQTAQSVFRDAINYKRVLIDDYAFAGPKQGRFAYVSFYTVNNWGGMRPELMLHELTHVWQYQRLGSVYIPRALRAQQAQYGYNYGGLRALAEVKAAQGSIDDFNLEQQGDIVLDYFRIKNGFMPRWGLAQPQDLPVYEYFIKNIYEQLA